MEKVVVVEDAQIFIPNESHKNFTHSGSMIEKDTIVEGSPKAIRGLRRGRQHIYRFFVTKDGDFIHFKKVRPMRMTEVKLGADAQVSPTKINMTNTASKSNQKYIGAIVGAAAMFAYAKYKKKDTKRQIAMSITGALIGFGVGYLMEGGRSRIKVEPSK